jgi:hypothetical protein
MFLERGEMMLEEKERGGGGERKARNKETIKAGLVADTVRI